MICVSYHNHVCNVALRSVSGKIALPIISQMALYLAPILTFTQNIGRVSRRWTKPESLRQHHAQFTPEVFENKGFLDIVPLREVDIALSWGQGGEDHRTPCTNRGRQIKWYKDLWLSRLRRLWRLLLCLVAKTVRRCMSHRMQQHSSRSTTTSWFTSAYCFGRAFRPVQPALPPRGGAYG